jgi:hypothetical protein
MSFMVILQKWAHPEPTEQTQVSLPERGGIGNEGMKQGFGTEASQVRWKLAVND